MNEPVPNLKEVTAGEIDQRHCHTVYEVQGEKKMLTGVLKRELWKRVLEDEQKLGKKADQIGPYQTPEFGFYFVSNGKP